MMSWAVQPRIHHINIHPSFSFPCSCVAKGGLLVAASERPYGALLRLERVMGQFPVHHGESRGTVRAAMMGGCLIHVAGGSVKWFFQKEPAKRWTWPGLMQAAAWTVESILVPFAFLLDLLDILAPIFFKPVVETGVGISVLGALWRVAGKECYVLGGSTLALGSLLLAGGPWIANEFPS